LLAIPPSILFQAEQINRFLKSYLSIKAILLFAPALFTIFVFLVPAILQISFFPVLDDFYTFFLPGSCCFVGNFSSWF
jgi:hypothetical protein